MLVLRKLSSQSCVSTVQTIFNTILYKLLYYVPFDMKTPRKRNRSEHATVQMRESEHR